MKFRTKAVVAATCLVALTGAAFAQADVIGKRQETMKAFGGALSVLVKMSKGEEPYDSAKAKTAVETIAARVKGLPDLFPAGSDKGAETRALPAIWTNNAEFKAIAAKLETTAAAQVTVAAKDLDGAKAALGAIGANCNACHDTYRLKK